jgi:translation initiation factor 5B
LENVVAGTNVFQLTEEDDVEELKDAVMKDVNDNLKDIATVPRGVFVQCSTLGSLEGLMVHLRKEKIPVAGVGVGPVVKKDVTRASAMLEAKNMDPDLFEREYASILAFNVKVDASARDLAEELGIKIFMDETIYNLTDQYIAYAKQMREERRKNAAAKAVFPAIVKIIPGNVFNSKNPLVIGVDVVRGCLMEGTPIVVPEKLVDDPNNPGQKMMLELGRVIGIEKDRVKVGKAVRGEKVCIKIQGGQAEAHIQVGRQFEESNQLVSKISRKSIDVLKVFFKEDVDALKEEGWPFIQNELKKVFKIQ